MTPAVPSAFIDRIYEAALVPERWPQVLDDLAVIAGAVGTVLVSADMVSPRWIASDVTRQNELVRLLGGLTLERRSR